MNWKELAYNIIGNIIVYCFLVIGLISCGYETDWYMFTMWYFIGVILANVFWRWIR